MRIQKYFQHQKFVTSKAYTNKMYYLVRVADPRYHGEPTLTYSSTNLLEPGLVVEIPVRNKFVAGFVVSKVDKPEFKTKDIKILEPRTKLPGELIKLCAWIDEYYPAAAGAIGQLVLPSHALSTTKKQETYDYADLPDHSLPKLTNEQTEAVNTCSKVYPSSVLIHGDTGTGKTRVYVELIKQQIAQQKSAIVLTPEIGLTPQLLERLEHAFGSRVIAYHSQMTPAQKRKAWFVAAGATKPIVVIGPRSALFLPVKQLGLIVIDECHDSSYKQDSPPYYQTLRTAGRLAKLHNAQLILGSATPSIEDYFLFKTKNLPIVRMKKMAVTNPTSYTYKIIDTKKRDEFGSSVYITKYLHQQIEKNYEAGQQTMLVLNKRGSARAISCTNCDWRATCTRCDLPYVFHADIHALICHVCNSRQSPPTSCPVCSNTEIQYHSIGVKTLESEVARFFPNARITRFDSDNLKADRLENQFQSMASGNIDILVGTQLLSKGIDLPKLGLVALLQADSVLHIPDYTTHERLFQLVTQLSGRVGRGHADGHVVIQTNSPELPLYEQALNKAYEDFYADQIKERQTYHYPPFVHMAKITVKRKTDAAAERACSKLYKDLDAKHLPVSIAGPAPAFHHKVRDWYQWQLILRAPKRDTLTKLHTLLPAQTILDIDPSNLL